MAVSAVPKNHRRRRLLALAALVVVALVLLLVLLTRRDPAPMARKVAAQGTTTQEQPPPRLFHDIVDAGSEPDAEPDPAKAPPGTIVYQRASLDDWRTGQGLPVVSPPLLELDEFRPEKPEEAQHPDFHEIYLIDRQLHRAKLLSEHEEDEQERFQRDAENIAGETWRKRLMQAAADHGALAQKYKNSVSELQSRRQTLVDKIFQQKDGKLE